MRTLRPPTSGIEGYLECGGLRPLRGGQEPFDCAGTSRFPQAQSWRTMTGDLQIEPRELKERLGRGERFLVVDVREPWEHQICRIEGARLIPLGSLAAKLALLEEAEDVVLYFHPGVRSLDAAAWLRAEASKVQGPWRAESSAGPRRSTRASRDTSRVCRRVMRSAAKHLSEGFFALGRGGDLE